MGPKAPTLAPKIRASSTEGCQFCPLSIYRQDPMLCDKIVQDLGCESLEHRRYILLLMMIFKIHQIVEVSDTAKVLQLNDKRTRGSERFKQSTCAITSYRDSFFPRTISDWNRLPQQATDCTTIEAFGQVWDPSNYATR